MKYYQIKIKSITRRGGAFLINDYNGNEDYFPMSQVFLVGDKVFASAWILEKKSITYSFKNPKWIKNGIVRDFVTIEKYTPEKIVFDKNEGPDESLLK